MVWMAQGTPLRRDREPWSEDNSSTHLERCLSSGSACTKAWRRGSMRRLHLACSPPNSCRSDLQTDEPTFLTRSAVPTRCPSHGPPRSRSAGCRSPLGERRWHVGEWHDKAVRSRSTELTSVHSCMHGPAVVTAGLSLWLQRDLSQVSLDEVGESNSTHSPAPEEVDDCQQYDCTKQRGHQASSAEVFLIDGATPI